MEVVAVDLGGTHARLATATLRPDAPPQLSRISKYRTADYPDFGEVWATYSHARGGGLPRAASIAVAGPVEQEVIRLTNLPWQFRPVELKARLGLDDLLVLNDFAAVAAAVGRMDASELVHLCGPTEPLPIAGLVTVVGLGTGFGVAQLLRHSSGNTVLSSEGGHIALAAHDAIDAGVIQHLRQRFGRVSAERIVSGPGLRNLVEVLAAQKGACVTAMDDAALWEMATAGSDPVIAEALDHLIVTFGAVAGDLVLAHGANALVITGSLANRISDRLRGPSFKEAFSAKGRLTKMMARCPVRMATHADPGLLGAAAAFQDRLQALERTKGPQTNVSAVRAPNSRNRTVPS